MLGLKALLLFSLSVNYALVSGYQEHDTLEALMKRLLDQLESRGHLFARQGAWDSYIDNLIAQSKDQSGTTHVDRACIIGLDGGSKWTTDGHQNALILSQEECTTIAGVFKSQNFAPFMSNGVTAEGTTYNFLREEDKKVVYAKKKDFGALTLQKSKTAIVIAHCPEGHQQGNANKAVAVIAEYLESLGM